ncbi:hypothetical protein ACQP2E_18195 [Actinoplanes sp. CA-015351]|uniref:hypothetical protein n=1 Tax=Actinoplanes sp. CA-015351 TaxID=3239897 RepID=UPI003D95B022
MAIIAGAWLGSVAALIAWHHSAPELPDKAWGAAFTQALLPDARNVEMTLMPQIAEYEERAVQEEMFGFAFFGGDDYYAGQLIIEAHAEFPGMDQSSSAGVPVTPRSADGESGCRRPRESSPPSWSDSRRSKAPSSYPASRGTLTCIGGRAR